MIIFKIIDYFLSENRRMAALQIAFKEHLKSIWNFRI
jgi:hypothetical protein